MKVRLDGIRVMKRCECDYYKGTANFTKRGLNRRNVLHELYHHVVEYKGIKMPFSKEERMANAFVKETMRRW